MDMTRQPDKFVSEIDTKLQPNGELYTRFHLGPFVAGQALTIANALRRTLLSEIPGLVVTHVRIDGVTHEFATLPGIQENILQILFNIKRMVVAYDDPDLNLFTPPLRKIKAFLAATGPRNLTAADINFPALVVPLVGNHPIARVSSTGRLRCELTIQYIDPLIGIGNVENEIGESDFNFAVPSDWACQNETNQSENVCRELSLDNTPKPVRQVNFGIYPVPSLDQHEYISLEICTDGSIRPKVALQYALEKLTRIFYEFTNLNAFKNQTSNIIT
jgi:DNA-directed RNA polymerase subunit alpha